MNLVEYQKRRRKRGVIVLVLAMFFLANATRMAAARGVSTPRFLLIYASGIPLGAGIAIVVASYRIMREIGLSGPATD